MPESTIVMTKSNKLEPAIKKKAYAFLEKLAEDDAAPGLHIEPIKNAIDKRVRTGRVDQGYRAVLFKLTASGANTYVFHGVWPHDDAIKVAIKTVLTVNPVNGIAELRVVEPEPAASGEETTPWGAPPVMEDPITSVDETDSPAEDDPWTFPVAQGALVDELGIPLEVAARVQAVTSEDELLELAADQPGWVGQALLDLATGLTVEVVKEQLQLAAVDVDEDSDEDILEGLRHPAARMEFAEMEGVDELRRVIEDGDFGAWKVFLHPQQRTFVERHFNGAARVSGGAGTGKTVVVIHRARWLAQHNPQGRVLLTTFTRNLADALASDLKALDPSLVVAAAPGQAGVHVTGIDALASSVLRGAGGDITEDVAAVLGQGRPDIQGRTIDSAWKTAISAVGDDLPEHLKSPAFLAAEYGLVVLPARITAREDYLVVRRPGRGVRLNRVERSAVWAAIAAYRLNARMAGTIDFEEAAAIAAHHLERTGVSLADHVLVDEGQDFTPTHWQLLRAAVAEGPNDIFVAEDGHQRIYGHRLVLSHFGIRTVGRSRRLTLNYRTTAENLAYAVALLEGAEYHGLEDEVDGVDGYRSARRGPVPVVATVHDTTAALDVTAATVRDWLAELEPEDGPPESIAVLVRDRFSRDRVVAGLGDRDVFVRGVDRETVKPGEPVVMTMHRAKGTEFTRVILYDAVAASPKAAPDVDLDDMVARSRSLLYVAATRARDMLVTVRIGG